MVGLIIFSVAWCLIIREMIIAPLVDDNYNIIEKDENDENKLSR